jgi:CubicO group peptidase (beta-lactamase class C family)
MVLFGVRKKWRIPMPSVANPRFERRPGEPAPRKGPAVLFMLAFAVMVLLCGAPPASNREVANGTNATEDDVQQQIARIEGPQTPNRQGLDDLTLQDAMKLFHVPGVSIAVIKDFKIAWAKGYGISDVKTGQPVGVDTLFQAASISKPVTAMAVLRLVQEGRFLLDDDVNTLLKTWKIPRSALTREQSVTPRSLFSHTSGADDGFGFPGYAPGAALPSAAQVLNGEPPSNVGSVLFTRRPYQSYKYSGGGIVIMRLVLTDLLGESFEDILQANVLRPLGMSNSTFQQPLPEVLAERAARAHDWDGQRMDAPWHVYPELAPDGLWTTPTDLARFAIEVQRAIRGPSGTVLKKEAAREMVSPVGVGPYAVGFHIDNRGEGWYFSHGGSNWGYRCHLLAHIRKGYGVAVMTNGENSDPLISEIEARIAAAYHWDSLDKPLPR